MPTGNNAKLYLAEGVVVTPRPRPDHYLRRIIQNLQKDSVIIIQCYQKKDYMYNRNIKVIFVIG